MHYEGHGQLHGGYAECCHGEDAAVLDKPALIPLAYLSYRSSLLTGSTNVVRGINSPTRRRFRDPNVLTAHVTVSSGPELVASRASVHKNQLKNMQIK